MNGHLDIIKNTCDYAIGNIKDEEDPFACIITDEDGYTIALGKNRVKHDRDPTAHAEIIAIRNACKNRNTNLLLNCILYTNCEPCLMCLHAIYLAGIKTVYYGSSRKDAENAGYIDNKDKKEINIIHVDDMYCKDVFKM
jgi:tRNA(Arg) A34 adenosine deaminase TadA